MLAVLRNTARNAVALAVPILRNARLTVTVSLGSIPPDEGSRLSETRTLPAGVRRTGPEPMGTGSKAELLASAKSTGERTLIWAELVIVPNALERTVAVNRALPPLA